MAIKRRKLTNVSELPDYHSFKRGDLNGNKGTFYSLCEKLKAGKHAELKARYNNVVLCRAQKEYAPEINTDVLFVADKVIK